MPIPAPKLRQIAGGHALEAQRAIEVGLRQFIENGLSEFYKTVDWFDKENNRRKELGLNGGPKVRQLERDTEGKVRWDFSDMLGTINGLWQHFQKIFDKKGIAPQRAMLRTAINQLVTRRNMITGHRILGDPTEVDVLAFFEQAALVLRAAGADKEAQTIDREYKAVKSALTKHSRDFDKDELENTHDALLSLTGSFFEEERVIRPILDEENLRIAFQSDKNAYGVPSIPLDLFIEWQRAFRSSFVCAWKDDRPLAGIGMLPVDAKWTEDFLKYKVKEDDLKTDVIKRSNYKFWYFSGFSGNFYLRGTSEPAVRKELADLLGRCFLAWACENAPKIGSERLTIFAEATSGIGEQLLRVLGFERSPTPIPGKVKPRFFKETTLRSIKDILANDRFFNDSESLRHHVLDAPQLKHL